jgi:hypothetical protein
MILLALSSPFRKGGQGDFPGRCVCVVRDRVVPQTDLELCPRSSRDLAQQPPPTPKDNLHYCMIYLKTTPDLSEKACKEVVHNILRKQYDVGSQNTNSRPQDRPSEAELNPAPSHIVEITETVR